MADIHSPNQNVRALDSQPAKEYLEGSTKSTVRVDLYPWMCIQKAFVELTPREAKCCGGFLLLIGGLERTNLFKSLSFDIHFSLQSYAG